MKKEIIQKKYRKYICFNVVVKTLHIRVSSEKVVFCFSFAQRQSGKIRNQERINNNGINTFNNIFRVGWLIVNAMAEIPPFLSLN